LLWGERKDTSYEAMSPQQRLAQRRRLVSLGIGFDKLVWQSSCSLQPPGADKPDSKQMAHELSRLLEARTVVGTHFACARRGHDKPAKLDFEADGCWY
jgi:hypothetical protein